MDSNPANRRKFRRVAVDIPAVVRVANTGKKYDAIIRDISEGGAFVHCVAPIMIGDEVLVDVKFKETKALEAKVIDWDEWLKTHVPKNIPEKSIVKWARGSSTSGFGIEFVSIEKDKKDFLVKLIDDYEAQVAKTQKT